MCNKNLISLSNRLIVPIALKWTRKASVKFIRYATKTRLHTLRTAHLLRANQSAAKIAQIFEDVQQNYFKNGKCFKQIVTCTIVPRANGITGGETLKYFKICNKKFRFGEVNCHRDSRNNA